MTTTSFEKALVRVMIHVMLADGRIEEEETETIQGVFSRVNGKRVESEQILEEVKCAIECDDHLEEGLKPLVKGLGDDEKEAVFKAGFLVALSDSEFDEKEKSVMDEVATALGMDQENVERIIAGLMS